MTAEAKSDGAVRYCFILSLGLLILNTIAGRREGILLQEPHWDSGWYYTIALHLKHALEIDGLRGFAHEWWAYSKIHAPLVPALSSFLMYAFGETRGVACAVLVIAAFPFHLGTFRVAERLYGRGTAYAATTLLATFPACVVLSRMYLFEYVTAALFAPACWALLESERLTKWTPTLIFGLLAGLVSVSRMGAPALLVGPSLVMAVAVLRTPDWWMRWLRLGAATLIAILIAGTWYVPNWNNIMTYLHLVTYGENAQFYAGKEGAFTLGNLVYYVHENAVEGPGVLSVAAAAACLGAAFAVRGRGAGTALGWSLTAAYTIGFALLLLATQHVGARYFLPLMPLLAIFVVRGVASAPWEWLRRAAIAVVALMGALQLFGNTLLFTVPLLNSRDTIQIGPVELWRYRSQIGEIQNAVGMLNPVADMRVDAILDRLCAMELPRDSMVYLMTDHPFFSINAFGYRQQQRPEASTFSFSMVPGFRESYQKLFEERIIQEAEGAEVLVVRSGGPSYLSTGDFGDFLQLLFARSSREFRKVGEPEYLGDGSIVRLYRRVPEREIVAALPPGAEAGAALFAAPDGSRFRFVGSEVSDHGDDVTITVFVKPETSAAGRAPGLFVHLTAGPDGAMAGAMDIPSLPMNLAETLRSPSACLKLRVEMKQVFAPAVRERGCRLMFGLLWPDPKVPGTGSRLRISDTAAPTDEDSSRMLLRAIEPAKK